MTKKDKNAAYDMYVELSTRITTQRLKDGTGDEKTALESIYQIFPLSRAILKKYGRNTEKTQKIVIVMLNKKIRPFTTKWHGLNISVKEFRDELQDLQHELRKDCEKLANIAGVTNLSK